MAVDCKRFAALPSKWEFISLPIESGQDLLLILMNTFSESEVVSVPSQQIVFLPLSEPWDLQVN